MQSQGMEAHLTSDGLTAAPGTPEAFGALIAEETKRWGELVQRRGIKAE